MDNRLDSISFIVEEILTNPLVDCTLVTRAGKLAAEDNYLYDLMLDYAKEPEGLIKTEMLNEIINYTDETVRTMNLRNEL